MLRISALVIVLVTAIGLYKKAWLPEKHCIRAGFFVYYTHLSNLLILLYELALGASGHDPPLRRASGGSVPGRGAEYDAVHLCDAPDLRICAAAADRPPAGR